MVKSPDKLRIHYQNLAIVSHPFVLPAPSFAVRHFCSGLLSIPVNLLQHFIFSIMKQIIYATNRKKTKTKKKNHLRLSGGSLVRFSKVTSTPFQVMLYYNLYRAGHEKPHLSCNHIFPIRAHCFHHLLSHTTLLHSFKK